MRAAVVTGASRGIGKSISEMLRKEGYRVFGLCRNPGSLEGVDWIPCDVTSEDSVKSAFSAIRQEAGMIDLLVNNAGMGISGAAEFAKEEEIRSQLEVNLLGAVRCSAQAVPLMRSGGGRIVFVSSLAAVFPIPFQSFYSMSKASLNSFSDALGMELKPFGIETAVLMLGDMRTEFTANRKKNLTGNSIYEGRISRSVEKMEQDEQEGMRPEQAAKALGQMLKKKKLPPRRTVGTINRLLVFCGRILPKGAVLRLLYRLYG